MKSLPKKMMYKINTANTLKNCPECKKYLKRRMMDNILMRVNGLEEEPSEEEFEEIKKEAVRSIRTHIKGDPLRGEKKFVAYSQHIRTDIRSCQGTRYAPLPKRVHHKNEYSYTKDHTVYEAITLCLTKIRNKDYIGSLSYLT